ncbi:GyrI-like domain-containing protein [Entomomonas asaccharolytica]|uniref:GyrI-like domain-containing protein n=1 Tax=Entomomonas asaccharolytica TaxID=2785331 RepID=A0A974RXC0_9GAMM|nr:GyrI-like domain-containing protein [Entomomonas asaccharolytica]QQP84679.1 GyrI-like domain-containing protein [Entomomonas asaccharolytica]
MSFQFTVVELPEIQVAGITVDTDMEKAMIDCPALWHTFAPRICSELADCVEISKTGDSYGISKMIDENRFTYWAAVQITQINTLPADFKTMTIPAGLYVKAQVPNLDMLGEALTAMYMQWPQSQTEYQLDMQGVSLERYEHNWQPNDPLEIFAAVIKQS